MKSVASNTRWCLIALFLKGLLEHQVKRDFSLIRVPNKQIQSIGVRWSKMTQTIRTKTNIQRAKIILMMIKVTQISKLWIIRAVLKSSVNNLSKEKNYQSSLKSIIQMESLQSLWSKTQERVSHPEDSLIVLVNMKMTIQVKLMGGQ